MNKKKITKIISFLLVLILLISFPLQTQANAVAIESWLIWSIVTYATAVGFTFTAAGGINALYSAVEDKTNEYNNIIDFYEVMRNNIRFVPNPNRPPNTDLLSLFFTAAGVEAMSEFLSWLTSDGGWAAGAEGENTVSLFLSTNNASETYESIYIANSEFISTTTSSYIKHYRIIGDYTLIQDGIEVSDNLYRVIYNPTGFRNQTLQMTHDTNFTSANPDCWTVSGYGGSYQLIDSWFPTGYTVNDVIGCSVIFRGDIPHYFTPVVVFSDNTCVAPNTAYSTSYGEITSVTESFDIITPEEVIKPLPTVQEGLLMSNVELGSTDAIEWAKKVEELFIETGTIPNPEPEVIQDPDLAPEPTPVPTPVPSPEIEDIEDLGLPTLGDAIFSKFPFSLPKDVGRIFQLLHAEPVTPYWQVDLTGDALGIPSNFEVDLAEYEVLGQITRWFSVISYCLFLILITRGMIKW